MIQQWQLYALLSAVFAGTIPVIAKLGFSSHIDNTVATTVRSLVMTTFLLSVSIVFDKIKLIPTIQTKAFFFIALSGLAGALSWLLYFLAIKLAPMVGGIPAIAALDKLSVIFALILSILFLGDKLTIYSAIGALLITAGTILMNIKK
jgi:bacterial/archaeal transporter family protein